MKIKLLTVGKTAIPWVQKGIEEYSGRIVHYIPFEIIEIPELKNVSALSREQIKSREAELILRQIKSSDNVILLDEHGSEWTSVEFSHQMESWISRLGKDMVFVIGGAYGFAPEVYGRADSMMSLSKMTFSHQGVRVIFVEQLYRSFTIMRGEPYHHE